MPSRLPVNEICDTAVSVNDIVVIGVIGVNIVPVGLIVINVTVLSVIHNIPVILNLFVFFVISGHCHCVILSRVCMSTCIHTMTICIYFWIIHMCHQSLVIIINLTAVYIMSVAAVCHQV